MLDTLLRTIKNSRGLLLAVFSLLMLSACVSAPVQMDESEFSPTYASLQMAPQNSQGSIFNSGSERSFFEDMKARRIGDILTVMLVEQTSGQNSSDNSLSQSTSMDVSTPTFGGSSRANMGIDLDSANSFNGASGSSQSNSLNGSVSVTVTQVLRNGNLVIEGEKWLKINQGNEFIRVQGVIRPKDVDAFNSIRSTQIADARISYGGKGTNARNTTPGWAAKILFSPLWPF